MQQADIQRAAHDLVLGHGRAAARVAFSRVHEMIAVSDEAGELRWKRILSVVREMQRLQMEFAD
jgi:hypothetical protein